MLKITQTKRPGSHRVLLQKPERTGLTAITGGIQPETIGKTHRRITQQVRRDGDLGSARDRHRSFARHLTSTSGTKRICEA